MSDGMKEQLFPLAEWALFEKTDTDRFVKQMPVLKSDLEELGVYKRVSSLVFGEQEVFDRYPDLEAKIRKAFSSEVNRNTDNADFTIRGLLTWCCAGLDMEKWWVDWNGWGAYREDFEAIGLPELLDIARDVKALSEKCVPSKDDLTKALITVAQRGECDDA